jgi:16S rRNA (adenine1518-N6/adenine1519-N6)-dimethyltransferase
MNDRSVTPKKSLGQHFLKDEDIALQIVNSLPAGAVNVLEIGPGMGVLTKHLIENKEINFSVVEIDRESVSYLQTHFPTLNGRILAEDFLKVDLLQHYPSSLTIIGNFPYNISSQILFKVLENKEIVTNVVGMFQKEVAERVASKPGNKQYGILSVLLQAFYDIEYLFTVEPHCFYPPPKVRSGVISISRNPDKQLHCDERLFKQVVKTAFNQRRKTLRNSLKSFSFTPDFLANDIFNKRPEQIGVEDFEKIVCGLDKN